jgi:hypothetical protein
MTAPSRELPPAAGQPFDATALSADASHVLVRVLRVAFPHPDVPAGPYERTAAKILAEVATSTWWRVTLAQGLNSLNDVSGGEFTALGDADALEVLRRVETSAFFGFVRRMAVLNLYDDAQMWEALGYEGPSYDKGGYVDRGFADLEWLPDPRIETYDGPEPFVAFVPDRFGAVPPATGARPDTSNQPGQHEAEMGAVTK